MTTYYSARKVAKILNVSTTTVIDWIKKGVIKAETQKRINKTYYKIPESEVLKLKKMLEIE